MPPTIIFPLELLSDPIVAPLAFDTPAPPAPLIPSAPVAPAPFPPLIIPVLVIVVIAPDVVGAALFETPAPPAPPTPLPPPPFPPLIVPLLLSAVTMCEFDTPRRGAARPVAGSAGAAADRSAVADRRDRAGIRDAGDGPGRPYRQRRPSRQ